MKDVAIIWLNVYGRIGLAVLGLVILLGLINWYQKRQIKKLRKRNLILQRQVILEIRFNTPNDEEFFRKVQEFYDGIGNTVEASREAPDRSLPRNNDWDRGFWHPFDRRPDWESFVQSR